MLSRFSLCGGQGLKKVFGNFQPICAATTSAAVSSSSPSESASAAANHPPEYPPPGPKRDFVNFPRVVMRERPPPVRMGFIPESWFQAFYPKTGYTGFYTLMATFGTYLFSKEIVVLNHYFVHFFDYVVLIAFIHYKFGDKIRAFYDKCVEEEIQELDGSQAEEKNQLKEHINFLEGKKAMKDAIVELTKARTEVVQLQLEMSYRERVAQAFKTVKSKLDCQAELDNLERRASEKILIDYVLQNVMKSITPDFENNVMKTCISDLNALAAKA